MVNMKCEPYKPEKAAETALNTKDTPRYPWGLSITLDEECLKKLGMTSLPKVGSEMSLTAKVSVTSASSNETEGGGERRSISLQITDMELSSGEKKRRPEDVLYDKAGTVAGGRETAAATVYGKGNQ